MHRKIVFLWITIIIFSAAAGFAAEGDLLLKYGIIKSTQLTETQLSESISRNEFYSYIQQLTANQVGNKSNLNFKDIIPNSQFYLTAQRLGGLGLLLPDQTSGTFQSSKSMTYEDTCYVMLKLLNKDVAYENGLQQAYESGILKDVRVLKKNMPITKKDFYRITENSLLSKNTDNKTLSEVLGLEKTQEVSSNQAINTSASKTQVLLKAVQPISATRLLVNFQQVPSKQEVEKLILLDPKQKQVAVRENLSITQTDYLLQLKEPLVNNITYKVEAGNTFTFKYTEMNPTKLYCIEELSRTIHSRKLKLTFNTPLEPVEALKLENYKSLDGLVLNSVQFDKNQIGTVDLTTLVFETSEQVPGKLYRLTLGSKIQSVNGSPIEQLPAFRNIGFYGASYDINEPKISSVLPESIREVAIQFTEASDLNVEAAENIQNYKVYDVDTKKEYKVIRSEPLKNSTTGLLTNIRLTTEPLDRLKRYMIEVSNLSDAQGNKLSTGSLLRGSFALSGEEETKPKLISIDALSRTHLKLIFNKTVLLSPDFKLEDVELSSNIKVIAVFPDPFSSNAIVVETSDHSQSAVYSLRIANVQDKFSNVTTRGDAVLQYSANLGESSRPRVTLVENNMMYGKNIITINFDRPMDRRTLEDSTLYKLEGLELLYVYPISDTTVKIVTSAQKKGYVYYVILSSLEDRYGATIEPGSARHPVMGYTLD